MTTFAIVYRAFVGIKRIGPFCHAWMYAAAATLVVSCGAQAPAAGQVRGQVVDGTGRPLPFVVVISRTRNGFLARYTNVDGRFAFPNRPHRAGDELSFQTAGYQSGSHRLRSGTEEVTYVMQTDSPSDERTIGLADQFSIRVEESTDGQLVRDSLVLDRPYRVNVTWPGMRGCSQPGPLAVDRSDDHLIIAIAEFVKGGSCAGPEIEHSQTFDYVFSTLGPVSLSLRGRSHDLVVPLIVVRGR